MIETEALGMRILCFTNFRRNRPSEIIALWIRQMMDSAPYIKLVFAFFFLPAYRVIFGVKNIFLSPFSVFKCEYHNWMRNKKTSQVANSKFCHYNRWGSLKCGKKKKFIFQFCLRDFLTHSARKEEHGSIWSSWSAVVTKVKAKCQFAKNSTLKNGYDIVKVT